MANLPTEASNKSNGAVSDLKNRIVSSEQHLEKMAQNAGERIGTMASDLANSTADSMKSSREYVKENPVKGVAMAAAAGVVAGSLLTMLLRNRKN